MEHSNAVLKVIKLNACFINFIKGGKNDDNKRDNVQLIVCLGYNQSFHYFSPIFFAILQSKTVLAYKTLHNMIGLLREGFFPRIITVDFESAHIEVSFDN